MFCLTVCTYVLQVFFSICMLTYIYLLFICSSLLIGGTKKSYFFFTENDHFTSSCTWKYQGSYNNQHGYIIKRSLKRVHRSQI